MRYTTARFGETVYLLGEFVSGLALGTVTISIIDLASDSLVTLSDNQCTEVSNTSFGAADTFPGFSTYTWPTSNIDSPSLVPVQYLYIMEDTSTGRVQKGKFTVGGFTDDSAIGRYYQEVHITPTGTSLQPIGTMALFPTLTFNAGSPTANIVRGSGSWSADGFAVGDYIQITGADLNNGVFGPITIVTALTLTFTNGNNLIQNDTQTGTEVIISKNFEYDIGTKENPTDNLYDANLIAQVLDINTYHLRSGMTMTVDFDHANWAFLGDDPDSEIITFDGHSTEGCSFTTIGLIGDFNGRIGATRSIIGNTVTPTNDIEGVFNECGFSGSMLIAAGGTLNGIGLAARNLLGVTVNFINGGSPNFLAASVYGIWNITNMTGGVTGLALAGATVAFANSCTGGTANLGGTGEVTIQNSVTTSITNNTVKGSRLDENVSDIVAFVS